MPIQPRIRSTLLAARTALLVGGLGFVGPQLVAAQSAPQQAIYYQKAADAYCQAAGKASGSQRAGYLAEHQKLAQQAAQLGTRVPACAVGPAATSPPNAAGASPPSGYSYSGLGPAPTIDGLSPAAAQYLSAKDRALYAGLQGALESIKELGVAHFSRQREAIEQYETLSNAADDAERAGDYNRAAALYMQAARSAYDKDARVIALSLLVSTLTNAGRHHEAVVTARQLVRMEPTERQTLAGALEGGGWYEEAIREYEAAGQPDWANSVRGKLYWAQQEAKSASGTTSAEADELVRQAREWLAAAETATSSSAAPTAAPSPNNFVFDNPGVELAIPLHTSAGTVTLDRVLTNGVNTAVLLSFHATTPVTVTVHGPGHPDAYFLRDANGRIYPLLQVTDMALEQGVSLAAGQSYIGMLLVFSGSLDQRRGPFDLIEGANQNAETSYWNFLGFSLLR